MFRFAERVSLLWVLSLFAPLHAPQLHAEGGLTLRFSDQTGTSRIRNTYVATGLYFYAGGGAAGDFDGDGWQDLFVSGSAGNPDRLFLNNRNGTFTDKGLEWGLRDSHTSVGVAVGDYNSDGWLDVFATNLGPWDAWEPGYHKLYRNNRGTSFTEVAKEAGVNLTVTSFADGFGAAFGDHDLDGDLDLFVCAREASVLFRNNGDGTFTDVTFESHIFIRETPRNRPHGNGFSSTFVDMDGDRYPELLYVADNQLSRYFKNNGDGTFTDLTKESGTGKDQQGMGQAIGDFNDDGLFDWYVTSIFQPPGYTGNKLYINQGNHVYEESAESAGVVAGGIGWGALAVDFNHDGLLDLAETNGGHGEPFEGEQSYLWLNSGDGTFTEQALALGFRHTGFGRGTVSFDYDNDGDQDVVIFANGSAAVLLRNDLDGPNTNWLRVFLDTSADPDLAPNGFGSTVSAVAGGRTQIRSIDGGESYLSKSELSAHFGLGRATTVDELRVEWSNGETTVLSSVPPNQTITVSAPERGIQKPGDCNQDGRLDISDGFCVLGTLFLQTDAEFPCGGGTADDPANLAFLDANGDGRLDLGDAVRVFGFLFLGQPAHPLGTDCVELLGCPDNAAKCRP